MLETLNESDFTRWLGELIWGFPVAEVFHLLMLTTFLGSIVLLDLRLLGVNLFISSDKLMHATLRVARWAFTGVVVSGFILCLFMPLEYSINPAFLLKMGLIALAGLNAFLMHRFLIKDIEQWDVDILPPWKVRLSAVISLCLWASVLACGRLIAYYYTMGM